MYLLVHLLALRRRFRLALLGRLLLRRSRVGRFSVQTSSGRQDNSTVGLLERSCDRPVEHQTSKALVGAGWEVEDVGRDGEDVASRV